MSVELLSDGSVWGTFVWGVDRWRDAIYKIDDGVLLGGNGQDTKRDTRDIIFNDGGKSEGSEIKSRKVVVSGKIIGEDRDSQREALDDLRYQASRPGLRLRLDGANYWIHLTGLDSITEEPTQPGFDRAVQAVRITWQADDPFWYSASTRTVTQAVLGNATIPVDGLTGGKPNERGQSPVITVTAPAGGSVPSFSLANLTDGGLNFTYSDRSLANGASVVIDCYAGTVSRVTVGGASTNSVRFFDGEFLRLLTKNNQIQYTGPPATVSITWRPRWV